MYKPTLIDLNPEMETRAKDTDYAWAAGFIEADGCIFLDRSERARVHVIVVQKDRSCLERLQRIFGTNYTIHQVKRGTRRYWRLDVSSARALNLLLKIYPYLEYKRVNAHQAINLLLHIQEYRGRRGQGVKIPAAELQRRQAMIDTGRLAVHAERLSESAPALAG